MSTLGECTCGCHINPNIKHVMACCQPCPKCERNIMTHIYGLHVSSCTGGLEEKIKVKLEL